MDAGEVKKELLNNEPPVGVLEICWPVKENESAKVTPDASSDQFEQGVGVCVEANEIREYLTTSEEMADLEIRAIEVPSDWMLIQRTRFDLTVFDEPHFAMHLFLSLSTGTAILRVWGRTVDKKFVPKLKDVQDLCREFFYRTVPCLGFYDVQDVPFFHTTEFDIVAFPLKRQVSRRCRQYYKLPESDAAVTELLGIGLCSECLEQPKIQSGVGNVEIEEERLGLKAPAADTEGHYDEDPEYDPIMEFIEEEFSSGDYHTTEEEQSSSSGEEFEAGKDNGESDSSQPWKGKRKRKKKKRRTKRSYSDLRTEENGRIVYKCPRCSDKKYFSSRALNYHRSLQHGYGPFVCKFCQDVLDYADELFTHFCCNHFTQSLACPICNKETFSPEQKTEFLNHRRLCHRKKLRIERKMKSGSSAASKKKIHSCFMCPKRFVCQTVLNEHINWHNGVKPHKCKECDFATSFATSMYSHNKIHMREKGMDKTENDIPLFFPCDICNKSFNSSNYLREHKRKVHEGRKDERVCEHCGLVFSNRTNLRRHKARSHPKDTSRQCSICGHIAADKTGYLLHQRVHKEGEFVCRFCAKVVKSRQTLMAHERLHTGENPFKCQQCSYACKSSSVLRRHILIRHEKKSQKKAKKSKNKKDTLQKPQPDPFLGQREEQSQQAEPPAMDEMGLLEPLLHAAQLQLAQPRNTLTTASEHTTLNQMPGTFHSPHSHSHHL